MHDMMAQRADNAELQNTFLMLAENSLSSNVFDVFIFFTESATVHIPGKQLIHFQREKINIMQT